MRDHLLVILRSRLDQYAETRDPRVLLDPEALRDAASLFASSSDPERDLETRRVVGWLHWYRHGLLNEGPDLARAVTLLRPVHQANPGAVPEPLRSLFDPAPQDWATFSSSDILDSLDSSKPHHIAHLVHRARHAAAITPHDHPEYPTKLAVLGTMLSAGFKQTEDVEWLHESVQVARRAAAAAPPDHRDHVNFLSNLGTALLEWFEWTDDVAILNEAIDAGRRAVAATQSDTPLAAAALNNLAITMLAGFQRTGDLTILKEAIDTGRQAVNATLPDNPQFVLYLSNLGGALQEWSHRTRDREAQDEAVRVARQALAATPRNHSAHVLYLANLGSALNAWFDLSKDRAALDEAVKVGRQAVHATPPGQPGRARRLSHLGSALRAWFETTDDLSALTESVDVFRKAVAETPEDHPDMQGHLGRLSYALLLTYERSGTRDALQQVIEVGRRALAATPADHSERMQRLIHLTDGLRIWYELTGELETLDEAIELRRRALETGGDTRANLLSSLSIMLRLKFERTRERSTLEEAITAGRAAVTANPECTAYLSNLGCALAVLAEQTEDLSILDEAIQVLRKARQQDPDKATSLVNLANPLELRFERTGDRASIEEAIEVGRRAVALTPNDSPQKAVQLFTLGNALRALHRASSDPASLTEAIDVYLAAATTPIAATGVRVEAGRTSGQLAMSAGRIDQALEGYSMAVELLPQLTARFVGRDDAEHWLGRYATLAPDAAACALQAGDAGRALTLLEQGRGVLLAHALASRGDLTELREHSPALADRFRRLSAELDAYETSTFDPETYGSVAEQRREHARRFETLIDEIRALPGFERFLLPPTVSQLTDALPDGAVALINISYYRCDALILTSAGVQIVPLPAVSFDGVRQQVSTFTSALNVANDPKRSKEERRCACRTLGTTLSWLWDAIAGPVLDMLDITHLPGDGEPWPRLWWAPVGLLSYLPLHAAGHHDEHDQANPRTVLDRVVSSYTVTVRALAHARRKTATANSPQLLVVAMPHTPDAPDLPGTQLEADLLAGLLPGTLVLTQAEATHQNVVTALRDRTWAHFACHGHSRLDDPSRSELLIQDHQRNPLTVRHISQLRLAQAELAYLSACSTTQTSPRLVDEAIHITAAFQLAGYPHVIGTLWTIYDHVAADMAVKLYTSLLNYAPGQRDIALAVHHATHQMRDHYRQIPILWSAHIHTGP